MCFFTSQVVRDVVRHLSHGSPYQQTLKNDLNLPFFVLLKLWMDDFVVLQTSRDTVFRPACCVPQTMDVVPVPTLQLDVFAPVPTDVPPTATRRDFPHLYPATLFDPHASVANWLNDSALTPRIKHEIIDAAVDSL